MRIMQVVLAVSLCAAAGFGLAVARAEQTPKGGASVVVFKSPTCGCCSLWAEHVRSAGFQVDVQTVGDEKLSAVATEGGVTEDLRSCHTAKVGAYTIEGHVPASDIQRLVKEKPAIAGIAVPGMPMGSPGMEQGGRKQPFDTIAFTKAGKKTVFASHR
jgi:hypothetical protein